MGKQPLLWASTIKGAFWRVLARLWFDLGAEGDQNLNPRCQTATGDVFRNCAQGGPTIVEIDLAWIPTSDATFLASAPHHCAIRCPLQDQHPGFQVL